MSCFVVSNKTIDAVVMAIAGESISNLPLIMGLGYDFLPKAEINPDYEEIWPELNKIESLQALGDQLLNHNIEAYEFSQDPDPGNKLHHYEYKCNFQEKPKPEKIESLMAVECYMYQIVDHEEETRHPIFKLLKEVCTNLYREYVRALPEWDQSAKMWC